MSESEIGCDMFELMKNVRTFLRISTLSLFLSVSTCGATAAATAASAATLRTGYLATPTEQLAVPGNAANGEITPEGNIYTGWAEYELRIGPALQAWNQPTRPLPNANEPLFSSSLTKNHVVYTQRIFT